MSYQVDFEPLGRRLGVGRGVSILTAAQQAGVGLVSICGGKGTCGRCQVQVLEGQLSPLSETEAKNLTPDELASGYRLACQAEVLSDLRLHIPPHSLTATQRTQVEGRELTVPIVPVVVGCDFRLSPPTREDIRSDVDRMRDHLALLDYGDLIIDFAVLRQLSTQLREWGWSGTVGLRGREVVSFGPLGRKLLGLAVDLGTTKLAGYLVELQTGRTLAAAGAMNPQIAYGEDVMARIAYAMEGEEQAATLREAAVGAVNDLAHTLCTQSGHLPEEIVEAVVVGNTAMHHLFLGLPVRQLGLAPYLPAVSDALDLKAREVGLEIAPGGYVHLLPNIAGFVGTDHVAMILSTKIYEAEGTVLGLDIGTNTEVVLRAKGRLIACSTASGPAFEGAHIKDGMRAAEGAIERLRITASGVEYQTIGDAPAVGICGSGVLDAVAQLRQLGVLDERGNMGDHHRVRRTQHGPEFVLVAAGEGGNSGDVVITRGDVGEIQLAKGAIRAGINILLDEAGLSAQDIDQVIIAGAFGTYIDVSSAIVIGMFPPLALERFNQVGNAAGMGAKLALVSREQRARAAEVARQVEYIELTNDRRFVDEFARAMYLK
ncbi:MAG: DUF4445 domain-containing protein [Chloroflexi bacterium]|nr:DUF4445 domain-containing protein [Chloroflexota bacterium]